MGFHRRHVLGAALPALAALPATAAGFREDSTTAVSVDFASPRAPLSDCLQALAAGVGVKLDCAPALAGEPLTACSLGRPLRELMAAMEQLYDATWTSAGGGYRLVPEPAATERAAAGRVQFLRRERKAVDEQVAETVRKLKAGALSPTLQSQKVQAYGSLLWNSASPADRDRVFAGHAVHFAIAEAQARPVYEMLLSLSSKKPEALAGPILATIDLEDSAATGFPQLRTRASARRGNSVLSIITTFELPSAANRKPLPTPEGRADDPLAPQDAGDNGRLQGTREELILLVGKDLGVPVLSRHRPYGGTAGLPVAGRRLGAILHELAQTCEATVSVSSRGFCLLRSRTEALDSLGRLPPGKTADLKLRFAGTARPDFQAYTEFGSLTPFQISLLERSNICTEAAEFAGGNYAILRFYSSLSPEQRSLLFRQGVDAAALSHAQLHMLLDQRDKRGDFDVYEQMQELKGLVVRFGTPTMDGEGLVLQTLRGGKELSRAVLKFPEFEDEDRPQATRSRRGG